MGDGPKQEEDGEAAGDCAHEINAAGGGVWVIAEEDDEEAAEQYEEGGPGRMGNLQFIAAGDEFSAVPEAAGGFHGEDVDGTGDEADGPAGDQVHPAEAVWRAISLHVNKLKSIFFYVKAGAGRQIAEDQRLIYE